MRFSALILATIGITRFAIAAPVSFNAMTPTTPTATTGHMAVRQQPSAEPTVPSLPSPDYGAPGADKGTDGKIIVAVIGGAFIGVAILGCLIHAFVKLRRRRLAGKQAAPTRKHGAFDQMGKPTDRQGSCVVEV